MKHKPQSILLVDDKMSDNFLSSRTIKNVSPDSTVVIRQGGQEAMDYLTGAETGNVNYPAIIFVDINMPRVNGWEFLRRFESLPTAVRQQTMVCMLTTSKSEEDRQRAAEFDSVRKFCTKPLSAKCVEEVVELFFETVVSAPDVRRIS